MELGEEPGPVPPHAEGYASGGGSAGDDEDGSERGQGPDRQGSGSPSGDGPTGPSPGSVRGQAAGRRTGYPGARSTPTCQVPGCHKDLSSSRGYHQRYKICDEHFRVNSIELNGQVMRFCQQCGKFQPLGDFNEDRRSCSEQLALHAGRRRKRHALARARKLSDALKQRIIGAGSEEDDGGAGDPAGAGGGRRAMVGLSEEELRVLRGIIRSQTGQGRAAGVVRGADPRAYPAAVAAQLHGLLPSDGPSPAGAFIVHGPEGFVALHGPLAAAQHHNTASHLPSQPPAAHHAGSRVIGVPPPSDSPIHRMDTVTTGGGGPAATPAAALHFMDAPRADHASNNAMPSAMNGVLLLSSAAAALQHATTPGGSAHTLASPHYPSAAAPGHGGGGVTMASSGAVGGVCTAPRHHVRASSESVQTLDASAFAALSANGAREGSGQLLALSPAAPLKPVSTPAPQASVPARLDSGTSVQVTAHLFSSGELAGSMDGGGSAITTKPGDMHVALSAPLLRDAADAPGAAIIPPTQPAEDDERAPKRGKRMSGADGVATPDGSGGAARPGGRPAEPRLVIASTGQMLQHLRSFSAPLHQAAAVMSLTSGATTPNAAQATHWGAMPYSLLPAPDSGHLGYYATALNSPSGSMHLLPPQGSAMYSSGSAASQQQSLFAQVLLGAPPPSGGLHGVPSVVYITPQASGLAVGHHAVPGGSVAVPPPSPRSAAVVAAAAAAVAAKPHVMGQPAAAAQAPAHA